MRRISLGILGIVLVSAHGASAQQTVPTTNGYAANCASCHHGRHQVSVSRLIRRMAASGVFQDPARFFFGQRIVHPRILGLIGSTGRPSGTTGSACNEDE
jgi:hypothetical protein